MRSLTYHFPYISVMWPNFHGQSIGRYAVPIHASVNKYKFIRGLINEERYERKKHWMRQAAESTSRAIVTLDLTTIHVKNVTQATELDGIGAKSAMKLGKICRDSRFSSDPPPPLKFVSSASALLVAMHLLHEKYENNDFLDGSLTLVTDTELWKVASVLSEERFEPLTTQSSSGSSGSSSSGAVFCQAWWRLGLLCTRGYIKQRTRNKRPVYEMLEDGLEMARAVIERSGMEGFTADDVLCGREPEVQAPAKAEPDKVAPDMALQHLYTNADDKDGVIMYVDLQEGGGQRKGLSAICKHMEEIGLKYATRRLVTGDYSWVWSCGGQKVELPVLVERKRADDLAGSVMDGRFGRQKDKMQKWAQKYEGVGVDPVLTYVLEGDPNAYVVRCADGCGGVGKCGNPSVPELQVYINDLDESGSFNLIRTTDTVATVKLLQTLTRELEYRVDQGDFYCLISNSETLEHAPDNNATKSTPLKSKASKAAPRRSKIEHDAIMPVTNPRCKKGLNGTKSRTAAATSQSMNDVHNSQEDVKPPKAALQRSKFEHDAIMPVTNPRCKKGLNETKSRTAAATSQSMNDVHSSEEDVKPAKRLHTFHNDFISNEEDMSHVLALSKTDYIGSPRKRQRCTNSAASTSSASLNDDVIVVDSYDTDKKFKPEPVSFFDFNDTPSPAATSFGSGSLVKKEPKKESDESDDDDLLAVKFLSAPGNVFDDIPCDIKWKAELKQVKEILTDFDEGIVLSLLDVHQGNVERVMAALLDG